MCTWVEHDKHDNHNDDSDKHGNSDDKNDNGPPCAPVLMTLMNMRRRILMILTIFFHVIVYLAYVDGQLVLIFNSCTTLTALETLLSCIS